MVNPSSAQAQTSFHTPTPPQAPSEHHAVQQAAQRWGAQMPELRDARWQAALESRLPSSATAEHVLLLFRALARYRRS